MDVTNMTYLQNQYASTAARAAAEKTDDDALDELGPAAHGTAALDAL